MASASICKLLMQERLTGDLTWISTRSAARRSRLCKNLQWKCTRPRPWEPHRADFARSRAVDMHTGISQKQFHARSYRKNAAPQDRDQWTTPGSKLCATLHSRNAHGHLTREISCENSLKNTASQERDPRFVRACAVEMHLNSSQDQF